MPTADPVVENLTLDLLEWISRHERTYTETIDAWRTSCPRLPIWEEANDKGFVRLGASAGTTIVNVTAAGQEFLTRRRP